jgi:hypothetical protein
MQQTSGSSFCRCGDGDDAVDECFVMVSFLSLSSPSFLDCRGGGVDEVVVVVDVSFLDFGGGVAELVVVVGVSFLTLSLALFVANFSCTNRQCSS